MSILRGKKEKRKSLVTQLLGIMLGTIVATSAFVSLMGGMGNREIIAEKSQQTLKNNALITASQLDSEMSKIETSVAILADGVVDKLEWNAFSTSKTNANILTESLRQMALDCAKNTDGAVTYYVRFNPQYAHPTAGLYSQLNDRGEYQQKVPTDFSQYAKDDPEVSWYYTPVEAGKPVWMSPYYNEDVGNFVVSYIIPVFYEGESVGVVGMDISLEPFRQLIDAMKTDKEEAFFLTAENTTLFCDSAEDGSTFSHFFEGDSGYTSVGGTTYVYNILKNGFKIVISTSDYNINKDSMLATIKLIFASLAGILLGSIVGSVFITKLIRPLREVTKEVNQLGDYDLTMKSEKTTQLCRIKNEVGQIANAVNNLRMGLLETVEELVNASSVLSATSEELVYSTTNTTGLMDSINTACMGIAEGAGAQAESTTLAGGAVREMGELIDKTREMLRNLETVSAQVKNYTNLAGEKLKNVKESNVQVAEVTDEITKSISSTSLSADKIKKAADMITEIASQTSLLSLNASIEAARAGDAGRGFAVVAGEIQKLSDESNKAAIEICKIINELVSNSNQSVHDIQAAKEITNQQTIKLDEAIDEFMRAREGIERNIEEINHVGEATESLDTVKLTVYDTVSELSAVAEENAASTQETASSITMAREVVAQIDEKAKEVAATAVRLGEGASKWRM